jgi:hypothetical protein
MGIEAIGEARVWRAGGTSESLVHVSWTIAVLEAALKTPQGKISVVVFAPWA